MYYHKMSLIVLSNTQEHYDTEVDGVLTNPRTGIQRPYSFHNHLSNTITIPPNSEIAVLDLKIKRNIIFDIKKDVLFYWYFGELLSASKSFADTTNLDTPIRISPGQYTWSQFRNKLGEAITDGITHPNFTIDGCVVSSNGAPRFTYTFTNDCTGSDISGGYEASVGAGVLVSNLAQKLMSPTPLILPAGQTDAGDPGMSYGQTAKQIRRNSDTGQDATLAAGTIWDNRGDMVLTDLPINMCCQKTRTTGVSGESSIEIDLNDAHDAAMIATGTGGWMIGLTRPVLNDHRVAEFDYHHEGSEIGGDQRGFYDYAIVFQNTGTIAVPTWGIDLYHSILDYTTQETRLRKLEYWGADIQGIVADASAARVTSAQLTNLGGAGTLRNLHIYMRNEGMSVVLRDAANAANTGVVLMDSTAAAWAALDKRDHRCFKPTGITTQALYPRFNISDYHKYFSLTCYDACAPIAHRSDGAGQYNGATGIQKSYQYPNLDDVPEAEWRGGSSFYGRCYRNLNKQLSLAVNVDSRSCYDPYDGLDQKIYVGINAGGAGPTSPDYNMGLITRPNPAIFNQTKNDLYVNSASGTGGLLGFGPDSYGGNVINADSAGAAQIESSLDHNRAGGVTTSTNGLVTYAAGGRGKWVLSGGNPTYNPSQLYIKSTTFTHQSYNFNKGLPSKILWSIPKFTNEGRDWGNLHFQNNAPVYLDLKNPNPVVLNDISIELCDKNEKLALDLGGVTETTFHIRQRK